MFDRLPVELVRHILQLAAPLDYTPSLYRKRRALLRSCCLVSKTMADRLSIVVKAGRKWGSRVLVLVFDGTSYLMHTAQDLQAQLVSYPNVEEIRVLRIDLNLIWLNG
ncbi:hypothetical protein JCM8547_001443 [Rhodosporidiobolus lusitaniae]